jgi:glycerol kinase
MNRDGEIVRSAYQAHPPVYPQPGWVEQDPDELWHAARDLLNRVMHEAGVNADEIAGIGLDNQGESVLLWDRRTGEALSRVLVWQDTRTQAEVDALAANPDTAAEARRRSGLKLDSYFSASKIRWLLDHASIAPEHLAVGTLDTWLIWKLTEGRSFVTDGSTAARTLLFNLHTLAWDDWLLNLFGIPAEVLPEIRESTGALGCVTHPDLLCRGVPIVASVVDQPAAMIGQGCLNAGQIKATYGTGCFINLNAGANPVMSKHGLLTILTWQRDGQPTYGLEGGVFTAGATLNWLRDNIEFFDDARQIDELCASDSGGALWIPAQIGLGAPYWNRTMRGAWLGIELATTKAHLTRAVLEGIAARVAQIVDAMQDDAGLTIDALRVDGGLTGSSTLMQIQADLLGRPVEVLANPEATAFGICALAARAAGLWADDEVIQKQVRVARMYTPQISEDRRQTFLNRFDRAVRQLEAWYE